MENQFPSDIHIRSAQSEDYNRLLQIQINAIKILNAPDYTPEQIEGLLENSRLSPPVEERDRTVFVAEKNEEIIGFATLEFLRIEALFVDPCFARQGVGTQLIKAIENEAKARTWKILLVNASLTGEPFYQACGYETTNRSSMHILAYFRLVEIPCVYMRKWIQPPDEWEEWLWGGTYLIAKTVEKLFEIKEDN